MTETEWLFEEIRKQFGEHPTHGEVHEWLFNNQWQVLKHMFPGCEDLLESVDDSTYELIVADLVVSEYDTALAEELLDDGVGFADEEDE